MRLIEIKKNTWIDAERIVQIEYRPLHQGPSGPSLTIWMVRLGEHSLKLDSGKEIEEAMRALESVGVTIRGS
jgi:hypothetical protein